MMHALIGVSVSLNGWKQSLARKNTRSDLENAVPVTNVIPARLKRPVPLYGIPYNGTRHAFWRGIQTALSGLPACLICFMLAGRPTKTFGSDRGF
jgi:hypothetical protein